MKRPILYIVVPFCIGIALSKFLNVPIIYPISASVVFIALAILLEPGSCVLSTRLNLVQRNVFSHIFLYLAIFFFGIAYYQNSIILPVNHISRYAQDEPQEVFVKGVVVDDPVTSPALYDKKKTMFAVKAKGLGKMGQSPSQENYSPGTVPIFPVAGLVRVSAYSDKDAQISFGDELVLKGLLSKPSSLKNPGVFDYEEYLAIKDIYAALKVRDYKIEPGSRKLTACMNLVQKSAYKFRNIVRTMFNKYLPPPYGGFLSAINIGDRSELSDDIRDDFVKTGTVHILAISGLNVGLIAAIFLALFGIMRIPRKINFVLTLIFLIFYSFAAGSNPPIVRATVMFAFLVIGYLIDRENDILNSLSLAAFLILLWNPKELFDPSFQLSFISLAGIIVLVPKINAIFGIDMTAKKTIPQKIGLYLYLGVATSMAAWIATWPVILAYFSVVSPVSVLANITAVPLLFILTAVSFLFIAGGMISSFFASLLAPALRLIEDALFVSNHFFAALPFSYFRAGSISGAFFALYYAAISLLMLPPEITVKKWKIKKAGILLAILILANIFIWKENLIFRRDALKLTFLDVGAGDSIFVKLPGGGNILIDGGAGGGEGLYDTGKSVVAPYLWSSGVKKIDAVIVTHFHADHMGGLIYILKNFRIGCVIDNGSIIDNSALYDEYKKILREKKIKHFNVGDGDVIEFSDGVKFFVLNPRKKNNLPIAASEENENSVVFKMTYKNISALLCGDVTSSSIEHLISYDSFLKSDILKVPHHGGHLGSEENISNFLELVSPKICIISAGKINKYNSQLTKSPEYITRLNSICYRTNDSGAIDISADGRSVLLIKEYRQKN